MLFAKFQPFCSGPDVLTHWGRVTHICVNRLTIIGSDNGLPPDRRQAIIWTNAGILLIGPLGTNFGEILIEILIFSFKKMHLKMSSVKRRPFCLGLNVLKAMNKSIPLCRRIKSWTWFNQDLIKHHATTSMDCIDGLVLMRCNSSELTIDLRPFKHTHWGAKVVFSATYFGAWYWYSIDMKTL